MKIREISIHYHLKHSLPNYGSVEYGAGITLELEEGETKEKAFNFGWTEVQAQVLNQMNQRLHTQELQERLDKVNKEVSHE
jgi:hypothetical protein